MVGRMRQTVIFTIFILSALTVEAKKFIYPIEIVAGTADIIVVGQIEKVKGNSYTFKISETLKGNTYETITVEKFKEWTCDRRFGKVEKGQQLCLFLKKGLTHWSIINGSTGERLISNDSIALGGYEEYTHVDYQFTPYRLSLMEFKNGIRDFCKCYEFIGKYEMFGDKPSFKQLCSDQQISTFKTSSKFSAWLNDKMTNYAIIKD
jgi:hypothetical protein